MAVTNKFASILNQSSNLSAALRSSHCTIGRFPRSFSSATPADRPEIELEFIGLEPGSDGSYPVEKAKVVSGENKLRNVMLENNIGLYASINKVVNCRGRGLCGTCIVEIVEGQDLLSERTNAELRNLKKKPDSWRLACQTVVGNRENSGKVVVQKNPQYKK